MEENNYPFSAEGSVLLSLSEQLDQDLLNAEQESDEQKVLILHAVQLLTCAPEKGKLQFKDFNMKTLAELVGSTQEEAEKVWTKGSSGLKAEAVNFWLENYLMPRGKVVIQYAKDLTRHLDAVDQAETDLNERLLERERITIEWTDVYIRYIQPDGCFLATANSAAAFRSSIQKAQMVAGSIRDAQFQITREALIALGVKPSHPLIKEGSSVSIVDLLNNATQEHYQNKLGLKTKALWQNEPLNPRKELHRTYTDILNTFIQGSIMSSLLRHQP